MEQFVREDNTIYIGGSKTDCGTGGVNIDHLGYGMSVLEHRYIIMRCFGIEFIIFKGSKTFDIIYPKFIEFQEKLYSLNKTKTDIEKYYYKSVYNTYKNDLEILAISISINYVNPEDILNYISKEKKKSYDEGYAEHKRQLREVFGLQK